MTLDHTRFHVKGELVGVGESTLAGLVSLGLLETGVSQRHHGVWRLTPDGWRCMYGKTIEEIMAPGGGPVRPLRVWKWPAD
jgi:hypothetical protein